MNANAGIIRVIDTFGTVRLFVPGCSCGDADCASDSAADVAKDCLFRSSADAGSDRASMDFVAVLFGDRRVELNIPKTPAPLPEVVVTFCGENRVSFVGYFCETWSHRGFARQHRQVLQQLWARATLKPGDTP